MTFWPLSSAVCGTEPGDKAVLPLRAFIEETLRRSRTSYSTLQVALYYLVLLRRHVPKHNSATEQRHQQQQQSSGDGHADRALQCGRRMFLAALILACKYLQDRNYSARAWSKISGLNTQEINRNEIAFLFAVKWTLHITEDDYVGFSRLVRKSQMHPHQHTDWNEFALTPESNISSRESLLHSVPARTSASNSTSDLCVLSPRSILNLPQEGDRGCSSTAFAASAASDRLPATSLSTPPDYDKPMFKKPVANMVKLPSRLSASTLSDLPSPRLTPRSTRYGTPAVSAGRRVHGRWYNSMNLVDIGIRAPTGETNLHRFPHRVFCPRRSSLANSISTASSPESMVPDSLRSSRSSSISSASGLASATLYNNNDSSVPLRFRTLNAWNDRVSSSKPPVPCVPEDVDENLTVLSSPEWHRGSETKLGDLTLNTCPPVTRGLSVRDMVVGDAATDAAKVLQDLHNHDSSCLSTPTVLPLPTRKRTRANSADINNHLHDNVRKMLIRHYEAVEPSLATMGSRSHLAHGNGIMHDGSLQVASHGALGHCVKRLCCSTEAASEYQITSMHPVVGLGGNFVGEHTQRIAYSI
ncbi:hypothetical protein E4U54_002689 [Claviceps lovelessii]|nr:hypothetical protein E4U54_002689 [Claviceps lovelessii]